MGKTIRWRSEEDESNDSNYINFRAKKNRQNKRRRAKQQAQLQKSINFQHRNPNQLHASMYIEEE